MQSHIKIKGKTLGNWLHFYLSEPRVLAEAAGCKSCFALTLNSQTRHIHMWRDMLMNYLSLKYSKSILAFQLQFGTMKPKVNIFDGKKKNVISTSGFQDKYTLYLLVILLIFDF